MLNSFILCPLDLMIDDLEMLELLAPTAAMARMFLSTCIYRMMMQSLSSEKLEVFFCHSNCSCTEFPYEHDYTIHACKHAYARVQYIHT